jgi:hypothetical protein
VFPFCTSQIARDSSWEKVCLSRNPATTNKVSRVKQP